MLEIKNLTKIYKNKKGKDVLALDNISLKFEETGMIFLLGKSGSGKSTLLNVTGGLDNPTTGEIIIKGKSSKNFTQSDFDSYRNTYIGFIFQEYNILDEFSVYDNIALALELQNKKVDHESIISLLKEVDLEGYEKRKPNTLSGGQKQRIAIARALIKHPEIIMADEPTGALDSNTGKQVLDTLKKLSKDRLVIVVSHDREFAETYADRIIELKDGKVIEDNTKTNKQSISLSNNINSLGDTLYINNAKELNESDFNQIKEFLSQGDKIILSRDNNGINTFKKVLKINDLNEQEIFEQTKEEKLILKEYDQNKNIFIKSKLPLKHAIKIGLSSLKVKPIRLLFTIFLCSISFLLFGLLSTMMFYNQESVFKDTLKKNNPQYIKLNKEYKATEISYYDEEEFSFETSMQTAFYEKEYNELKEKYGKNTFYGIDTMTSFPIQKSRNEYYMDYINTFAYMDKDNDLYTKITGKYPENKNEILLSSYIVDSMIYYNAYDSKSNNINIKNRDEIINKEFNFNGNKYKVVGYFDSGNIDTKYDEIKEENKNSLLISNYYSLLNDSLHLIAFVSKEELNNLKDESDLSMFFTNEILNYTSIVTKEKNIEEFPKYSNAKYIFEEEQAKKLKDDEIYVTPNIYAQIIVEKYSDESNTNIYNKALNLLSGGEYIKDEFIKYNYEELIQKANELFLLVKEEIYLDIQLFSDESSISFGDIKTYKIKGIYNANASDIKMYSDIILFNENNYNKYWNTQKDKLDYYFLTTTNYKKENTPYQTIYIPFENKEENINEMWNIYNNENFINESKNTISTSFISTLSVVDELVEILSSVFLYSGIFLCIFALLLLSNFISLSITNKTKEIGILRAIGARSLDVFKIFFSESFTIAIICLLLSTILSISISNIMNNLIASELGVSIFVFGFISFIIMVLLAVLTTIIATYIPVRKAAKKKPVETIRAL